MGQGRHYADQLGARALAALIAGCFHFRNQKSAPDVIKALGNYTATIGVSFGVKPLLAAAEPRWYSLARQITGGEPKGVGDLEDVCLQVTAALLQATSDPNWRSIEHEPADSPIAYGVICVPMKTTDRRWHKLTQRTEQWLADRGLRHINLIWVSANAVAPPSLQSVSPFWTQVSLFSAIMDNPLRPIQAVLDRPDLSRRHKPEGLSGADGQAADMAGGRKR